MSRRAAALLAVLTLAACADRGSVPDGDPREGAQRDLRGIAYREDALADASGRFHWAQAAIADYRRADQKTFPARVEVLDTASCLLTKPASGDLVRHVFVERGVGEAPIYQFSDEDVGARAERFVDSYVATKGKARPSVAYDDADVMRLVNVVVTEKSAPVHLVLTSETNVIWNILPAAGAQISAIAVVEDPYGAGADDGMPLAVGLFVDAEIVGESLDSAVVLPRSALYGRDKVYVIGDDDVLTERTVRIAADSKDTITVVEGIADGERVVTSPLRGAGDGSKVAPTARASQVAEQDKPAPTDATIAGGKL